jgi:hypothetical protein
VCRPRRIPPAQAARAGRQAVGAQQDHRQGAPELLPGLVPARGGGGPTNPPPRVTVVGATGEIAVPITDVATVELFAAPAAAPAPAAPVYATVEDRWGMKLTGYIGWSGQGILDTDVITRLEAQPDRRIPFSEVATIERTSGSRGRMVLKSGEEVVLAVARERTPSGPPPVRSTIGLPGTSVRVADPALGVISVNWGDIKSIRFQAPTTNAGYETFAPTRELEGTVRAIGGEEIAGKIRWDNDEVQGWELLNGRAHSDVYQVELAQVERIERLNTQRSKVTLRDGRTQELGQQNDVGWGNKGVIVTLANGTQRLVEWVDLQQVRFTP